MKRPIDSILFKFVHELPSGARIVIYGAGGRGIELFLQLKENRPDIRIISFADTSKSGSIQGFEILSPSELTTRQNDFDFICICSHWWKIIAVDLLKKQLDRIIVLESKELRGQMKEVLVSHEHKFIYLNIYRAASSSIKATLQNAVDSKLAFERIPISDTQFDSYFKFTFVRNPWDRVLSCYMGKFVDYEKKQGDEDYYGNLIAPIHTLMGGGDFSFETFVEYVSNENDIGADPHWRSLYTFACDAYENLLVDFVGRFENLEEDFRTVCKTIGIKANLIKSSASGKSGPFQSSYNLETRMLIETRFKKDIELFNYDF